MWNEGYDLSLQSVISLVFAEEDGEALRSMESTLKCWSRRRRWRKTISRSGVCFGLCDLNFTKGVVVLDVQHLEVRWVSAMVLYVVFVHFELRRKCKWELTPCGFSPFSIENKIIIDSHYFVCGSKTSAGDRDARCPSREESSSKIHEYHLLVCVSHI